MSYLVWGAETAARTVVCVHGLTGNARDFDQLAPALVEAGHRVVCPDVAGRGESDRLEDPAAYGLRQYAADMAGLLAHLRLDAVDWVGTSMGGLIGMSLAAGRHSPIRRMVINDIGPFVPRAALRRLGDYLGGDPVFPDLDAAVRWLRDVRAPFGPLTDAQWRGMADRTVRRDETGALRLHYDPRIAESFRATAGRDLDFWPMWERIACPVLVLRGEDSDLLLAETAEEMTRRGPRARVVEIAGCGHAPALMDESQVALVVDWLRDAPS